MWPPPICSLANCPTHRAARSKSSLATTAASLRVPSSCWPAAPLRACAAASSPAWPRVWAQWAPSPACAAAWWPPTMSTWSGPWPPPRATAGKTPSACAQASSSALSKPAQPTPPCKPCGKTPPTWAQCIRRGGSKPGNWPPSCTRPCSKPSALPVRPRCSASRMPSACAAQHSSACSKPARWPQRPQPSALKTPPACAPWYATALAKPSACKPPCATASATARPSRASSPPTTSKPASPAPASAAQSSHRSPSRATCPRCPHTLFLMTWPTAACPHTWFLCASGMGRGQSLVKPSLSQFGAPTS